MRVNSGRTDVSQPAEQASRDLCAALETVKAGSLRMFGDWFGRPRDNIHRVCSAESRGDDLVVTFDDEEELTISEPGDWEFNEHRFRVRAAQRVVWRWYAYGRPKEPENRFTIEHWINASGGVDARSDENWHQPVFAPSLAESAAELL